jgi:hypothetical protein
MATSDLEWIFDDWARAWSSNGPEPGMQLRS